jgi:hypothetical protein
MLYSYPDYITLDIAQYSLPFGFYTLGFIEQHRPDIAIIPIRIEWDSENLIPSQTANYDWLASAIDSELLKGKKVCLVPWDEYVVFVPNAQLTKIVNSYIDQPVYWITQLDHLAHTATYQRRHGFQCKMLELPWWLLNDCLTYYCVQQIVEPTPTEHNFLCMVNNPESHKLKVLEQLNRHNLSQYGLVTLSSPRAGFDFCQVNQHYPYNDIRPGYMKMAAQTCVNGVWISKNVENYLHLEHTYNQVPLIINPETVSIPFMSTEKSIWPVLLGHLFLVYGRPGSMDWIQKFYDVDINKWANLEFDSPGADQPRIESMLTTNQALITNARDVYYELKSKLELARWSFGRNMYNFFIDQLEKII